jgi:putative SOS response-associated peptidase YedK
MMGFALLYPVAMCGLYSFKRAPEEVRGLFNYVETPEFPPRQYVTPAGPMAIVRGGGDGKRHFALMRWGFVPSWAKEIQPKPLINARAETILEKPSFRNAIRRRRCLIPADGFYEWEGDVPGKKRPYYIERADRGLMAFAGIWEHWLGPDGSELETAAIITTEANALVVTIHPRSPVVIHPEHFETWLDVRSEDTKSIVPLMKPQADDFFVMAPTVIQRNAPPPKPNPPPKAGGGQMDLL